MILSKVTKYNTLSKKGISMLKKWCDMNEGLAVPIPAQDLKEIEKRIKKYNLVHKKHNSLNGN